MISIGNFACVLSLLFMAGTAQAVTLSYSATGSTSTGGTYSLSFTALLSAPTVTNPDGTRLFRDLIDGVETTLSILLDGTEIFNETTAGIRSVLTNNDGSLSRFSLAGNVSGLTGFAAGVAPDIIGFGSSDLFAAAYQPIAGVENQIAFLSTTDVTVTITDMPAVPLPAGGILLLSALGAGALLRRRKTA